MFRLFVEIFWPSTKKLKTFWAFFLKEIISSVYIEYSYILIRLFCKNLNPNYHVFITNLFESDKIVCIWIMANRKEKYKCTLIFLITTTTPHRENTYFVINRWCQPKPSQNNCYYQCEPSLLIFFLLLQSV